MKCFIDMDGVLANFVGAACRVHNRPWPYDDPKNLGRFEIEPAWGISPREFWKPIDAAGIGFWENLEKTEFADRLIRFATSIYGLDNLCILTSPSDDPACVPGKRAWMRMNYPLLSKNMLFGSAKQFLAGPDRVLIDDRDKNLEDFQMYGGFGVLVPQPWNRGHSSKDPWSDICCQIAKSVTRS